MGQPSDYGPVVLSDYVLGHIEEEPFEERHLYFWARVVADGMDLIGPETDPDLERMWRLLLDYYAGVPVNHAALDAIPEEIRRLRGAGWWGDKTPLGRKYRCLNALGVNASRLRSRDRRYTDLYDWAEGVEIAFQLICSDEAQWAALEALARDSAPKYEVDLHVWQP